MQYALAVCDSEHGLITTEFPTLEAAEAALADMKPIDMAAAVVVPLVATVDHSQALRLIIDKLTRRINELESNHLIDS